jgi:hypothetical protein
VTVTRVFAAAPPVLIATAPHEYMETARRHALMERGM